MTDVANTPDIRKKLMSGELKCCVIKAALVVDPLQIGVAANKATLREKNSRLTTKSIYTEILYVMSSSSNISQSLAKFGIHDKIKDIIVVLIHGDDDKEVMENDILRLIDGVKTPISRIGEFTDVDLVKKMYKIDDEELKVSSLLDSVVSRVASDCFVSMKWCVEGENKLENRKKFCLQFRYLIL